MNTLTEQIHVDSDKDMHFDTLHIINKSPSNQTLYSDCFKTIHNNDALLLIESAAYACRDKIFQPPNNIKIYVLQTDLDARGLTLSVKNRSLFHSISDDDFVKLCCQYKKTLSWF